MPEHRGLSEGNAFLLAGEVVFAIVAACVSSPQTAEINITKRADTLMKWVWVGAGTSLVYIWYASKLDDSRTDAYWKGGGLALILMGSYYAYAKWSGQRSGRPGTED
jgi:hypothetical protein